MPEWKYPKGTVLRGKGVPTKRECLKSTTSGFPCNPKLFGYLYRCTGALVPIEKIGPPPIIVPPQVLRGDACRMLPVVVTLSGDGFRLIDGYHRLSAIRGAGRKLIRAVIVEDRKEGLSQEAR